MTFPRPVTRSGFGGGGFSDERGLFRVIFGRKRTFLCAFSKKVDFLRTFFSENWHFSVFTACRWLVPWENFDKYVWKLCIERHYDLFIFHSELWLTKYVQNCGPFWTLWTKIVDHFGHFGTMGGWCFRTPRTPSGYGPASLANGEL